MSEIKLSDLTKKQVKQLMKKMLDGGFEQGHLRGDVRLVIEEPPEPPPQSVQGQGKPPPDSDKDDEDDEKKQKSGQTGEPEPDKRKHQLEPIRPSSPVILHKIQEVLKDNCTKRPTLATDSGHLNHKKIYRYKTNPRIFHKKDRNDRKKYCLSVILDCSGSMRDTDPNTFAPRVMGQICVDFQKYCSVSLYGFNNKVIPFKKMWSKELKQSDIEGIVLKAKKNIKQATYLLPVLSKTVKEMACEPYARKLVIVVTDARDADTDFDRAKIEIEKMTRAGVVVIGVAINIRDQENVIEKVFKNNAMVKKPEELYDVLLPLLKKHIHRNH